MKQKILDPKVIILILVAVVGGYVLYQNQIKPTSVLQQSNPEEITQKYYSWYVDCVNNYFDNSVGGKLRENCPYEKYDALDRVLIQKLKNTLASDPILCAQNTPDKRVVVDKARITNDIAQTVVHTYYSSSGDNPITIDLKLINNQWKIVNIVCNP